MSEFDVCIRGDGIVGHTLALLLARERLRVGLVRRSSAQRADQTLSPDVRVYALNSRSRALLESVRCWPDEAQATPVRDMRVYGDAGGRVHFDSQALGVSALTWIVDVPALENRLAQALQFAAQVHVLDEPAPAQLSVICEGRASATRQALGVSWHAQRYPQHALAARVLADKPHAQTASQWFSPGQILAFLPIDGPQGRAYGVVWSLPDGQVAHWLQAPPEAFCAELARASGGQLGAFSLSSERSAWALQSAQASRWCGADAHGHAWVLAGDAAHNVHPLAGQGLNLGLGDVAELVRVLAQRPYWRGVGDARLLRRYARARRAELTRIDSAMTALQRLFEPEAAPLVALRNWGLRAFDTFSPLKQRALREAMGI